MNVPPVLRELRLALSEVRQPLGREPVATFSEVAGKLKKNDNVIRKFEKAESAPKFDEVDDMVAAYSEATGVSVFDLWDEALRRARATRAGEETGDSGELGGERPPRDSLGPSGGAARSGRS